MPQGSGRPAVQTEPGQAPGKPASPRARAVELGEVTKSEDIQALQRTPVMKRKLEDRYMPVDAPQLIHAHKKEQDISEPAPVSAAMSSSPVQQPRKRKRKRYDTPPIWARSVKDPDVQWKRSENYKPDVERQPTQNGHPPPAHPPPGQPPPERPIETMKHQSSGEGMLGKWEQSITGNKPYDDLTKVIADWLFITVVNRNDWGELNLHQVEVEIEAKLGQIIDTATNHRYQLPVQSECILTVRPGDIQFRSSMTEVL